MNILQKPDRSFIPRVSCYLSILPVTGDFAQAKATHSERISERQVKLAAGSKPMGGRQAKLVIIRGKALAATAARPFHCAMIL